ncbi:hypothetical protein [Saccharothrix xinjiangensis]|uniref:hypothetical protein n=1 Tax=Saccharothrix xinjiangensis TaxID=204798 RepID=UPI0031E0451E
MRKVLVTTAFTGALMTAVSTSADAAGYWIHHYSGAYDTAATCGADRQAAIDQEASLGHMFYAWPCVYEVRNPETGTGPAGWYFRWKIFAE